MTGLSPLVRDTAYGRVEGIEVAGTYSWKGIPFARPPSGALRWKAPIEPEPWTGTRPAKDFAPASDAIWPASATTSS